MSVVVRILPVVIVGILASMVCADDGGDAPTPRRPSTSFAPSLLTDLSDLSDLTEIPVFDDFDLTADRKSLRARMADHGIKFDLSTTQFFQGTTCGGLQQQFQYGGRNDYFMTLDGDKSGLWQGGSITVHGETRYGESANTISGALSPVNLMLSVPLSTGSVTGVTGVKFTQVVSEKVQVYAGKLNTLDDFKQPFTGAGPLTGFQNSAMIYNPVYARTIPYSTFGAGLAYRSESESQFELAVYDSNNTPTVSGFNTLFNNGATVYVQGSVPTTFWSQPGHQGISGTYSTGTFTDLTPTAYLDPTAGLVLLSTPVAGSWCVTYNADQAIYVSRDDPKRTCGVFTNLGLADKDPSPVRWFGNAGLSGTSPIATRTADSFGIAYFYIGVSDSLKETTSRLVPLRDEYGIELYYNIAVTSRCQITPDLQVISPFRDRTDAALLVGLRAKIDF